MILNNYLREIQENNNHIKLSKFDKYFFLSLKDRKEILFDSKNGIYHTILYNGNKAGICGYIPSKKDYKYGFWQIVIHPDFRGLGILRTCAILVAKEYNLHTLVATIHKKNIASVKGHYKAGFKNIDSETEKMLRDKGFLESGDIRLELKFDKYGNSFGGN